MVRVVGPRMAWLVCAYVLIWGSAVLAASAATVEGRWRLVQQTYGRGSAEPATGTPNLRLELALEAGRIAGRVWLAGDESRRASWPAMFHEGEPQPVRVLASEISAKGDRVLVRYEAPDPADPGNVLEVHEEYRLVEGGDALVGTVDVRLRHDGEDVGGYRLRRRFERER